MSTSTKTATLLKGGEWLIKESAPEEIYTPKILMKNRRWCETCVISSWTRK